MSRDFFLLVFFMNKYPPSPRVSHWDHFKFFRKFKEIFASQGAQLVSMTPVANFATSFASVVDTWSKFATSVNNTGGILPPVSTTPADNLPPVANNGNNIRLLRPWTWRQKCIYKLTFLLKVSKWNILWWKICSICHGCQRHRWCTWAANIFLNFWKNS